MLIMPFDNAATTDRSFCTYSSDDRHSITNACGNLYNTYHKQNRKHGKNNLILPKVRTELYRKSFTFRASQAWNKLPKDVSNH